MKRLTTALLLASLVPAGLGFGPPAFVESGDAAAPLYADQVAAIERFRAPTITAASAVMVDGQSGEALFARDPDARRAMASVTKMMTALVALERGRLEATVPISVDAATMLDSSVMGLVPGEELTLEDLLYGLLLPSGNDAALAVAQYIGGGVSQFVALMNARAGELNLHHTRFSNPHGLDDPGHYSSASDLAVLARTAMANPVFAKMVATQERQVRGKLLNYRLRNTNALLGRYQGADGIKTGTTDDAGESLAATAQRAGARVFGVVLNSRARYSDTQALFDYYYDSFACQRPIGTPSPFDGLDAGPAEASADRWAPVALRPVEGPWYCRPAWQRRWFRALVQRSSQIDPLAGVEGKALFYVGDALIGTAPLGSR